jgi:SAM-dependent methyltransferase
MISERNLTQIYEKRFSGHGNYRKRVWKILVNELLSKWIKSTEHILDLGCGYGEFINHAKCKVRHAMDLNPKTQSQLDDKIVFHKQDCSEPWKIDQNSLDLVFTSNFFEHLPNKECLDRTMCEVKKALKPGGRLISNGTKHKCPERTILGFLGSSCCSLRPILV